MNQEFNQQINRTRRHCFKPEEKGMCPYLGTSSTILIIFVIPSLKAVITRWRQLSLVNPPDVKTIFFQNHFIMSLEVLIGQEKL
jgi:hypothetical protein